MPKILVTGGAGFIGSHIIDRLVQKKYDVAIVDNLSTGYTKNINPKAKFYQADINNYGVLSKIFQNERPRYVIHSAADIKVRDSVKDPAHNAKVNAIGSLNVIDCCKNFEVSRIANLSTGGALYGNPEYLPVDEKHSINPISPYGISKYAVELYLRSYFINFRVDFISLRFSNVYGPRDDISSDHVIPLFVYNMINGKSPDITGDGSQGRDFIYVADVVDAVILSLDKNPKERFLNIGTEKLITINDLFYEIRSILKSKLKPNYIEEKKVDVKNIYLNAKKAQKYLGWKAKTGLREGLIKTIKWFKEK